MNEKIEIEAGFGGDFVPPIREPESTDASQYLTIMSIGALAGSLATLQEFFDVLPVAVYTCEAPSGVITFYNAYAGRLWGRQPNPGDTDERFCGSFKLWRPDGTPLPHDQTPMAVALREGRSFRSEEVVIEQPDETRINVLVNIDPIHDATGRVVGAINAFHDITRLKEAEEALRQLTETLEERVKEQTEQGRRLASELITAEQTVRHRIANTLHDDMQQILYAAQLQLKFLRDEMGERSELDDLVQMIAEALQLTRQLTVELSPPVLKEEDLREELAWLARHMEEAYGLHVTLDADDHPQAVSREQQILLFQLVRELLFNVVKHAGVLAAEVSLKTDSEGITITVSDQGQGFDVAAVLNGKVSGYGLQSVHERLQPWGGRADIASQPGDGTRISLSLPYTVGG